MGQEEGTPGTRGGTSGGDTRDTEMRLRFSQTCRRVGISRKLMLGCMFGRVVVQQPTPCRCRGTLGGVPPLSLPCPFLCPRCPWCATGVPSKSGVSFLENGVHFRKSEILRLRNDRISPRSCAQNDCMRTEMAWIACPATIQIAASFAYGGEGSGKNTSEGSVIRWRQE